MSVVPGGSCRSKFVLWSRNPESPVKVQAGMSSGMYTCSKRKCATFACYKVCAHVIAVAIHNGDAEELVEKYSRSAKGPNLTDVAMMGMPNNAGKKPTTKHRRRKTRPTPDDHRMSGSSASPVLPRQQSISPSSTSASPGTLYQPTPKNSSLTRKPDVGKFSGNHVRASTVVPRSSLRSQSGESCNRQQDLESLGSPASPGAWPSQPVVVLPTLDHSVPSAPYHSTSAFITSQLPVAPSSLSLGHCQRSLPPLIQLGSSITQIQNQQVMSGSQASVIVSQPSCTYSFSVPDIHQPAVSSSPLYPYPTRKPFFVKFLTKQIKVCQGCRGGYHRNVDGSSLPPPYDIIIGHLDHQQFQDRLTGLTCYSKDTCLHFHAHPPCILAKYATFHPREFEVPQAVLLRLTRVHKEFLNQTFGLQLALV